MTLEELRRRIAELHQQRTALNATAIAENRALTDEEETRYQDLTTQFNAGVTQLNRATELEQEERSLARPQQEPTRPEVGGGETRMPSMEELGWAPGVRGFGEFLQAVRRSSTGVVDRRLVASRELEQRAALGGNELVPSDGGFLVGMDMANEILRNVHQASVLAQRARHIPISSDSNGIKFNGVDETSRVTGSRWGGVQVYWVAEAGTATDKKPKFRRIELGLHKLMGLYYATDELLADASALGSLVQQAFTEEMAWVVDYAVLFGTGAGQPLGIFNSDALVSVAKETGQGAATVVAQNIIKMWNRLYAPSRSNATWYVNQDVEAQLWTMTLPVGTGGVPLFMPPGGLSQSPYSSLMGRPVVPIEQLPSVGTLGDIALLDPTQYVMSDKGGIQQATSIHVQFLTDEETFRWILRTDGQPFWSKAITPADGSSNTRSPFVTLAARA
jgi:HK97 family phage major capsid protein